MKTLRSLVGFFLITLVSCQHDIIEVPSKNLPNQIPSRPAKYESKGYYLEGQFGNNEIMIRDTFYTIISPTNGASSSGHNPDSITLSFGTEFRIVDSTRILETFIIEFKQLESLAILDSKNNYKDLTKVDDVITEGLWNFCFSGATVKDKGVSVHYMDQRGGISQWFTESFDDQIFDYSTFKFQLDNVVNIVGDKMLIVEGSLECKLYNFNNRTEHKTLALKFRGPIYYYVER